MSILRSHWQDEVWGLGVGLWWFKGGVHAPMGAASRNVRCSQVKGHFASCIHSSCVHVSRLISRGSRVIVAVQKYRFSAVNDRIPGRVFAGPFFHSYPLLFLDPFAPGTLAARRTLLSCLRHHGKPNLQTQSLPRFRGTGHHPAHAEDHPIFVLEPKDASCKRDPVVGMAAGQPLAPLTHLL